MNKLILVPAALLISAILPWLITPLLMIGGLFLCFEGAEKLHHKFWHHEGSEKEVEPVDEKTRVRGAVRTDFILSAEIIVISLGTMANAEMMTRILGLSAIAIIMTVGVYGLVAAIVKADDAGLYLMSDERSGFVSALRRKVGWGLVRAMPGFMKALTVAGTAAMFLVGGSIVLHGLPLAHALEGLIAQMPSWPGLHTVSSMAAEGGFGVLAGFVVILLMKTGAAILRKTKQGAPAV